MPSAFLILAVALWVCVSGCQAVVSFDRSLLIDAGTDAGPDAAPDAAPDAGPDAGPDAP